MFRTPFIPLVALAAAVFALGSLAAAAQSPSSVAVGGNDDLGPFLVGPNQHTLYVFNNDTAGASTCFDQCEANWPPLTVAAGETPSKAADVPGNLGIFTRPDGSRQVTLDGQPLYYWAHDSAPGDATGQGVGGVWFVVPAQAAAPTNSPGTTPAAPTTGTGFVSTGDNHMYPLVLLLGGAMLLLVGATLAVVRR